MAIWFNTYRPEHAVVRTDKLAETVDRSQLTSVIYQPDGRKADIENGNFVLLSGLKEGSHEVYNGDIPQADSKLNDVALICSVEMWYDQRYHNIDHFINKAGKVARACRLRPNDVFSVTIEALDADSPSVGNIVELQNDTKLKVVSTATEGSTTIGKIIAIDRVGMYTYYAIEVSGEGKTAIVGSAIVGTSIAG